MGINCEQKIFLGDKLYIKNIFILKNVIKFFL